MKKEKITRFGFNLMLAQVSKDKETLLSLARTGKSPLFQWLIGNPFSDKRVLEEVYKRTSSIEIYRLLSLCKNCPPEILAELVRVKEANVYQNVLRHPNCPQKILRQFSKSRDYYARTEVANNPSCPPDVLRRLSKDKVEEIALKAVKNPNCPTELVRKAEYKVAAENPKCPADILRSAATWGDREVLHRVFSNPNCPVDLLVNYREYSLDLAVRVAVNKKTPPGVLDALTGSIDERGVFEALACNPNTPKETFEVLADLASSDVEWKCTLAQQESCPTSVLRKLAGDKDWRVRSAAARNLKLPTDVLVALAEDESSDVRFNVARNENTPVSVIKTLTEDESEIVRRTAIQMLAEAEEGKEA